MRPGRAFADSPALFRTARRSVGECQLVPVTARNLRGICPFPDAPSVFGCASVTPCRPVRGPYRIGPPLYSPMRYGPAGNVPLLPGALASWAASHGPDPAVDRASKMVERRRIVLQSPDFGDERAARGFPPRNVDGDFARTGGRNRFSIRAFRPLSLHIGRWGGDHVPPGRRARRHSRHGTWIAPSRRAY